jgi:hypothetical protein
LFLHSTYAVFIFIIIIVVIIIIIIISFMQGTYTYIPEIKHVPPEYSIAAVLLLLFMVPVSLVPALALLFFHVSTFRSMCAVPNMAVFCSSLTSWFPGTLFTYFLNDFEIVPVAPVLLLLLLLYLLLLLLKAVVVFLQVPSVELRFLQW